MHLFLRSSLLLAPLALLAPAHSQSTAPSPAAADIAAAKKKADADLAEKKIKLGAPAVRARADLAWG